MSTPVAIVGMAGRFPGSPDLESFWRNLRAGAEGLREFSESELRSSALSPQLIDRADYVRAGMPLQGAELFDAAFFEINPREAEHTDPQHRLFLECAWEALEHAGHDPGHTAGLVGVFGGAAMSGYSQLLPFGTGTLDGMIQFLIGNATDYLTTRVSYKLNLRGPSINVQTACSTSLVAIHVACQSLLGGECDMALAGGVAVRVNQHEGYVHQPGLSSSDGHCRAFDAKGEGTVFGNGLGIVVLKRLDDAIADGNTVYALIRGSAINNDGTGKAGFTAPSVAGQADVIAEALAVAGVDADQLSYIEAHGTATPLGDPIEVAALTKAFRTSTRRRGFCALGSVKTNIGHLESAAGVAGLIKTALALHHGELPASLHFQQPNPHLDLEGSPFFVNRELRAWPRSELPRLAGVSSFGIGGSNAHVVLEEAPLLPAPPQLGRPEQLLVLSARTLAALEQASLRLADHLVRHPDVALADVAHTLQVGRASFARRRTVVARDGAEAITRLRSAESESVRAAVEHSDRPVVFMFPGAGAQYAQMGRQLYQSEPVFRAELQRCHQILADRAGLDLLAILFPDHDDRRLTSTSLALPALIATEVALAALWRSFGFTPEAMIGHSVSEYVPAYLAGVFSLEDMLTLVARRGQLFETMERGSMLGVPLPEDQLRALLPEDVYVAALNAATLSVVSGADPAIERFAQLLALRGIDSQRLHIDVAAHSPMVDPILAEFRSVVTAMRLQPATIPFVSNVTGAFITEAQSTDPEYWVSQLRQTVRFGDGATTLMSNPARVFLEVGPGRTLATFCRQPRGAAGGPRAVIAASLPHAQDSLPEVEFLLGNVGRMWAAGVTVDWAAMRGQARPRRIALPSYPFERQRYWPAYTPRAHAEATAAPAAIGYARPALAVEFEMPCGQRELEIAALWQSLLGVDRLGRHDNFFELGGHSLLIAQMVAPLRERHRIELPLRVLFKKPTVAGFAEAIDELLAGGQDIGGVGVSEIQLPDDIVALPEPGSEASRSPQDPRVFLLTGATGFLGAFLLEELLARSDARVLCLVRARDAAQGLQRLRDNLVDHRIAIADLESRVEMIPGDLAAPRLGLDDQVFARLASEVDAIYHAGAQVNFVYPYEALKASNVGGTIEILRLATTARAKPLHFMSTTGVFAAKQYSAQHVDEDDPLLHFDAMYTGYVESKWVAERIVHLARERDIPVAIYRPAAVSGHQRTGASNRADFLLAMMQGCIALAAAPDVDISTYIAPVDFVASAIVALSLRADSVGHAFHLFAPQPISVRTVFRNLRDLGYPLEAMSFVDWRRRLVAAIEADSGHVLAGFLHMLDGEEHPPPPRLSSAATIARLTQIGHGVPPVDDETLVRACRTGYLPPPPEPAALVATATRPTLPTERPSEGTATMNLSSATASKLLNRDWPWGFRLGLFDLFLPINYDQSLQRAFEGLHLTPGQRLIDVGSGSGRLVVHAARWLTGGGQLTCVDIDAGGLAYSKNRALALGVAERVSHLQRDVCSLSGAELPAFDAAISHFSVYCLPTDTDRRRAIVEIAAVLRPGGRLVLSVPSESYQAHRLINDARRIEQSRTDAPLWMRTLRSRVAYPITEIATGRLQKAMEQGRFHRYSVAEVESHLRAAGFTKIEIQPAYADCGYVATAERLVA